ncbi:Uncharacterized protein GBIM_07701 [Gryllus bimaculatus]|nr:Uncharacterized protein GBIM_07701 [Gryllus bimaculatus]
MEMGYFGLVTALVLVLFNGQITDNSLNKTLMIHFRYHKRLNNNYDAKVNYQDVQLLEEILANNKKSNKYYAILGVSSSSDQETVRKAFLDLVKKYHPDSGSSQASKDKFHEVIETAYRKLQEKFAADRWNVEEGIGEYGLYYKEKNNTKDYDIKHTAPQHRQYLSYEGYGIGTPQQREKQYQRKRAWTAAQNVYNHRMSKIPAGDEQMLILKDKKEAKKIKTRSEMERLVEDLIQESMARGDFNNLSGSGKPLKRQNINPYVDFVTHKMNEVLIDNGFVPEWITLQKDVTQEINNLRDLLAQKRTLLGPEPLTSKEKSIWEKELKNIHERVVQLNRKINSFNLQVPLLNKQMIFFQLEQEAANILKSGKTKLDVPVATEPAEKNENTKNDTLVGFFEMFLFRKN